MLITMMMKILAAAAVVVLLVVSGCAALPALADERRATTIITSFEEWTMHHGKEYATTAELEKRRRTWLANQEHVEQHNAAYTAGYTLYAKSMHGPFADLDDNEFAASYLMEPQDCSATTSQHVGSGRLRPFKEEEERKEPLQVDWRTKGIMTPVKNQGACGSCWTFSTSGCLEAHVCLAAGKDCTHWSGLAEEQLVDCAGAFNNHGCNGGLPSQAFEYLKYSGGMALEDDYPYHAPDLNGTEGVCHVPRLGYKAVVSEVFNITQFDEDDLVHAIAEIGPVSVAYQVFSDFRLYAHGVYDSYNHTTNTTMCHSGSHDVNHAVVAVGLGTTPTNDGVDYYIIRNSWSVEWGMEGHFWIKRGENLCGISDCASFPIVPAATAAAAAIVEDEDAGDGFKTTAAAVMASRVNNAANDKTTMATTTTNIVSALRRERKE